jgi:hypothetical protein
MQAYRHATVTTDADTYGDMHVSACSRHSDILHTYDAEAEIDRAFAQDSLRYRLPVMAEESVAQSQGQG